MHHEHGSVCMENTTYQWIHEWQTFVGSSVSSMRTFSVSEEPECEVSGLHVWCVYADNTDVVQRRTSFCCFGSCYILGENSWRAQTSFCCHTWTRLDLHLCCFDVFYFSPQCQSPNDHCSVLHSSLGRCRTDILSHPELHTVSNLCLRLSLVRRPSQQPTLNLCVRWRTLVWIRDISSCSCWCSPKMCSAWLQSSVRHTWLDMYKDE